MNDLSAENPIRIFDFRAKSLKNTLSKQDVHVFAIHLAVQLVKFARIFRCWIVNSPLMFLLGGRCIDNAYATRLNIHIFVTYHRTNQFAFSPCPEEMCIFSWKQNRKKKTPPNRFDADLFKLVCVFFEHNLDLYARWTRLSFLCARFLKLFNGGSLMISVCIFK